MGASMVCREATKPNREPLRVDAAGTVVTLIPAGPLHGRNAIETKMSEETRIMEKTDMSEMIEIVVVMTAEIARDRAVLSVIALRRVDGIHVIVTDMLPATATAVQVAAPARHASARVNKIVLTIVVETGIALHRRLVVSERRAPTCSAGATKPPAEVPPHRVDNALRLLALLDDQKRRRPALVRVHHAGTERLHRLWKECGKSLSDTVLHHRAVRVRLRRLSLVLPVQVRQDGKESHHLAQCVVRKVQREIKLSAHPAKSGDKTVRRHHVGQERLLHQPVPAHRAEVDLTRSNPCDCIFGLEVGL